jgi:cytochrome c-type biogenesis protein CcmH
MPVAPSSKPRWLVMGVGVAVIAALLVVVGFAFGWFRPKAEWAAPPHAQETVSSVASLADLLPGLEAKVAANPKDISHRLLLAQTYTELGQRDKSIKELRAVHKAEPQNNQATILLATALQEGNAPADLREAHKLLEEAVRRNPAVSPMARLYQGDILMKLGDAKGAMKVWKDYLGQMPAGDPRRGMFEEKIAQASARK